MFNCHVTQCYVVMRCGAVFILLLLNHPLLAASFDCKQASQEIEKTICQDPSLSELDEKITTLYFKLHSGLKPAKKKALKDEQHTWLRSRTADCAAIDTQCLSKLYQTRYFELRNKGVHLVPFKPAISNGSQGITGQCYFTSSELPANFKLYAGGGYKGKPTDFQVDDSGHEATMFDVVVNTPHENVALLLGAYEPSVWNIGWHPETNIVAVYITGHHHQKIVGLPDEIPLIISSGKGAPCGRTYIASKKLTRLNGLADKVFGKNLTMVNYATHGRLVLGKPVKDTKNFVSSRDTKLGDVIDKDKPRAGKAGLMEAIRKGILRPARRSDYKRWAKEMALLAADDLPPDAKAIGYKAYYPRRLSNPYVVLKEFHIPAGLYGSNAAQFFVLEGVPYPTGKPGHSQIYDFNSMTCNGRIASCGSLRMSKTRNVQSRGGY